MGRRSYRSTSLFPLKSVEPPVRQRICNSAPAEVISDQEEDWDWESPHTAQESIQSQTTSALATLEDNPDSEINDDDTERTFGKVDIADENKEPSTQKAGDFTDFLDLSSSDSDNDRDDESDSDGPYEYWTKRMSYTYSPFSNCSSLSFEDSNDEKDSTSVSISNSNPAAIESPATPLSTTKFSRFSDFGPSVKRGCTAIASEAASFKGPTSI